MEGEGMVAVVRGLRDAGLAVTLLDGNRQYTLLPNSITQPGPNQRPVSNDASTQQCPRFTASSTTEPNGPQCDRHAQAIDGRYASMYKTVHCNQRPTSPPVQLTEFPPQRPDIYPGHGNFQVGGLGSGATYTPIRSNSPVNFRGAMSWPDRGSVCNPRSSHVVDEFANSLRKYPCVSPDRSSEVFERLINYTQAKGLTKTYPRNQTSPTRTPEPSSYHTLEPKGAYSKAPRSYEPEITIKSKRIEETPTKERKSDHHDGRLRNYDVRCVRDISKRARESIKPLSPYPYGQPVCPTIKETNDYQGISNEYLTTSNSVNMEIQAAVKMISKQVATVQREHLTRKTVAVPDSPISSAGEDNVEGECYFVPNLDICTSFKSIQTTFCPSDITLKPRKSAQTVCSTIDFYPRRNKFMIGRKSKSQEEIKVTKEDLKRSLLELIEEVSNSAKSKKVIRDELIKKLFENDRNESKGDRNGNKRDRCHKYVSTFCPSGCDYVEDFQELVGKLKHCYGDTKHVLRTEIKPFRISEYRQLDFVLKDWINDLNLTSMPYVDRGEILSSVEDKIKDLFKNRTKQDFDIKASIVKIIEGIPLEVTKTYNRKSYLHKLVDVLLRRMKYVVVNQQTGRIRRRNPINRSRKILTEGDIRHFLRAHLLDFLTECNIGICDEALDDIENEMIDVIVDSLDCIRCGHVDDAIDEMEVILQDLGLVNLRQASYLTSIILQDLQEMLNNCNFNQTYMILNVNNNSGQMTSTTNDTDLSIGAITQEDLNANLDHYTNQLCQQINEWLNSLNIPQIQDRGLREVVVNDLAGDIVDRHKYMELNNISTGTNEEELEVLKYQIFKWINKLVGDENQETLNNAKDLLKKVNKVTVPMLIHPQHRKIYSKGANKKGFDPMSLSSGANETDFGSMSPSSGVNDNNFDPMRPCLGEMGSNTCKEDNLKLMKSSPCCLKVDKAEYPATAGVFCGKESCPNVKRRNQSTENLPTDTFKIARGNLSPQAKGYGDLQSVQNGQGPQGSVSQGFQGVYAQDPGSLGQSYPGSYVQDPKGFPAPGSQVPYGQNAQGNYGQGPQASLSPGSKGSYAEGLKKSPGTGSKGPYAQGFKGSGPSSQASYGQDYPWSFGEGTLEFNNQGPLESLDQDSEPSVSPISQASYGQSPKGSYGLDLKGSSGKGSPGNYGQDPKGSLPPGSQASNAQSPKGSYDQDSKGSPAPSLEASYGQSPKGSYGLDLKGPLSQGSPTSYGQAPKGSPAPGSQASYAQSPKGSNSQDPNRPFSQGFPGPYGQTPNGSSAPGSQASNGQSPRGSYGLDPKGPLSQGSPRSYGQAPKGSPAPGSQATYAKSPKGSKGQDPNRLFSQGLPGPYGQAPNGSSAPGSQASNGQSPRGSYGLDPKRPINQGPPGSYGQAPKGSPAPGTQASYEKSPGGSDSPDPKGPPNQGSPESYGQGPKRSPAPGSQASYAQSPKGSYGQDPNRTFSQGPPGPYEQAPKGPPAPGSQAPYGQSPRGSYSLDSKGPPNQGSPGSNGHAPKGSPAPSSQASYAQSPKGSYGQDPNRPSSQGPPGPYGQALKSSPGPGSQGSYGQSPKGSYGQSDQGSNGQGRIGSYSQGPQGPLNQRPEESIGQGPQASYNQGTTQPLGQGSQAAYGKDPQGFYPQNPPGLFSQGPQGGFNQSPRGPNEDTKGSLKSPNPYGQSSQGQGSPGFLNGTQSFPPSGTYGQGSQYGQVPSPFTKPQNFVPAQAPYSQPTNVIQVGPGATSYVPTAPNQQFVYDPNQSSIYGAGMPDITMRGPQNGQISAFAGPMSPGQFYTGQMPPGSLATKQLAPGQPGLEQIKGNLNTSGATAGPSYLPSQTGPGRSGLQDTTALTSTTQKQINEDYDDYLKKWVEQVPVSAKTPAEAEKARLSLYNGIWKGVTKMKLDPEVFSDPYYYKDVFDDEMEELFKHLPKSPELEAEKSRLKEELLQKTMAMNDQIKSTNEPASFKQRLAEVIENNLPKQPHNKDDLADQQEEIEKQDLADYYVLYTRYKGEDTMKAAIHKKHFLKNLDEFLEKLKKRHNIKDMDTTAYANEIINALDKVPLPNAQTMQEEADDILIGMEVDNWMSDLPLKPEEALGPLEKRRTRNSIVKKIEEVGTNVNYGDTSFSKPLKAEIPKYLEKLHLQEGSNVDYMIDELANRIKNTSKFIRPKSVSFQDPGSYGEFSKNVAASSSFQEPGQVNANYYDNTHTWYSGEGRPQEGDWQSMQSTVAPTGLRDWSQGSQNQSSQPYLQNVPGQVTSGYPDAVCHKVPMQTVIPGPYGVQGQGYPNTQGGPVPINQVATGLPCCPNIHCTNRGQLSQVPGSAQGPYGPGFSNVQSSPIPYNQDITLSGTPYASMQPNIQGIPTTQNSYMQGAPYGQKQGFSPTAAPYGNIQAPFAGQPGQGLPSVTGSTIPGGQTLSQSPYVGQPGQTSQVPYGQAFLSVQGSSIPGSQVPPQGFYASSPNQIPSTSYNQGFPSVQGSPAPYNQGIQGLSFGLGGSVPYGQGATNSPMGSMPQPAQLTQGSYGQPLANSPGQVQAPYGQLAPAALPGQIPYPSPPIGQVFQEPYGQDVPDTQGSLYSGHVPEDYYGQSYPNGQQQPNSAQVQSSVHSPTLNQTAQSSGPVSAASQVPDPNLQEMAGGALGILGVSQDPGPSTRSESPQLGQKAQNRSYPPPGGLQPSTGAESVHPDFHKSTDSKGIKKTIDYNKRLQQANQNARLFCVPNPCAQSNCRNYRKKSRDTQGQNSDGARKKLDIEDTDTSSGKEQDNCRCVRRPRRCRSRKPAENCNDEYSPCPTMRHPCFHQS